MGCRKCDDTGWISEHEPETGFVDVPCPDCRGRDGEEPDIVTEGHDALTEMEAYTFVSGVGIVVLEADASSGHSSKQGLAAVGFLLLAEGHLRKARERLEQGSWSGATYKAHAEIIYATNSTRHALELLKQEKEEMCKP